MLCAVLRVVGDNRIPRVCVLLAGIDEARHVAIPVVDHLGVARQSTVLVGTLCVVENCTQLGPEARMPLSTCRACQQVICSSCVASAGTAISRSETGRCAVARTLLPAHAAVVEVLSRVAQFKVVVVNDVEGATSDERARLAIDKGVVVYVPTRQLVVQVNSLQSDTLNAR